MKQIILLLVCCCSFAVLDVNAQNCSKSAAARLAAADKEIVKNVSTTGEMTYLKKKVCPTTGNVTYSEVEYCSKSGKFIAVAANNYTKSSCKKSVTSCSKNYSKNAMAASNLLLPGTSAQKAACLQANQKTQAAKTAFASLDNQVIKP